MLRPGTPPPVPERPTAAERVRTLTESDASAVVTLPGARPGPAEPADPVRGPGWGMPAARTVTATGDVLLLLPSHAHASRAAAHAAGGELTAVLEITDVAPVAVAHRIRGRGRVAGWLTGVGSREHPAAARLLAGRHPGAPSPGPAWRLLRLEVGEARTDDLWGAGHAGPEEFAAAVPDPLARHEAELLQHLAAAHGDQVGLLCALLGRGDGPGGEGPAGCAVPDRVVPLSLDRFGLRVRLCGAWGHRDAWFAFGEPVRDVAELRRAMHRLFEAAATAGRSGGPMRAPGRGQP